MSTKSSKNVVVHPLFDKPEKKVDPAAVGPMKMTRMVRFWLIALRAYVIAMIALAFYRTIVLAGVFQH
jgi:hypothetical protein